MNNGHEFEYDERYANLMYITAVTLLFSSGMPLLYPIATAFFFAAYWTDKILLFKYHRKPDSYDTQMARKHLWTFPFMLILHGIVGAAMYANSLICPTTAAIDFSGEWAEINGNPACWTINKTGESEFNFQCGSANFRLYQFTIMRFGLDFNQAHVFMFVFFIVAIFVVYPIVYFWSKIMRLISRKSVQGADEFEEEHPEFDIYRVLDFGMLVDELEDTERLLAEADGVD